MSGTRARSPTRYGWWLLALLLTISAACGGAAEPATQPGNVQPATVQVEVYFTNDTLGDPCTDVFGVTRIVDRDQLLTGTLQALLAGPTPTEIDDGYGGWFGPATADALLDAHLDDDGTVHVTFTDLRQLIPNASTSCGSTALLAMLDTTLLALDGVTATRYALADQTAFYGWLQLDDPDAPAAEEITQPEQPTEPDEPAAPTPPEPPETAEDDTTRPGVDLGRLTEQLEAELVADHGASLATLGCDAPLSVRAGDVLVCTMTTEPPLADAGMVVAVIDDAYFTWTFTDLTSTAQLVALHEDLTEPLFCRDIRSGGAPYPFGGWTWHQLAYLVPAYAWSAVYWNLEGQPARMDADGDGIPCETLYPDGALATALRDISPQMRRP
jgi:hypothetical protein